MMSTTMAKKKEEFFFISLFRLSFLRLASFFQMREARRMLSLSPLGIGKKRERKNKSKGHEQQKSFPPSSRASSPFFFFFFFSLSTSTSLFNQKTKKQPIVHIGFIPTIVVLGMLYTDPKPSIAQLLSPM